MLVDASNASFCALLLNLSYFLDLGFHHERERVEQLGMDYIGSNEVA